MCSSDLLPTAGFTISASGLSITCADASSVSGIGTYFWDFGDGTGTSTQQSPSYTYAASGTYNVCLSVGDSCGTDSICQTVTVIDSSGCPLPTAGFTISTSGLSITCADASSVSGIGTYFWDFGDGTGSSIEQSPSYTFEIGRAHV